MEDVGEDGYERSSSASALREENWAEEDFWRKEKGGWRWCLGGGCSIRGGQMIGGGLVQTVDPGSLGV